MSLVLTNYSYHYVLWDTLVRYFFTEKLPDNNTKTIDIREEVEFLITDDFRSHPLIRANSILICLLDFLSLPRKPEITKLNLPILPNEDIGAL